MPTNGTIAGRIIVFMILDKLATSSHAASDPATARYPTALHRNCPSWSLSPFEEPTLFPGAGCCSIKSAPNPLFHSFSEPRSRADQHTAIQEQRLAFSSAAATCKIGAIGALIIDEATSPPTLPSLGKYPAQGGGVEGLKGGLGTNHRKRPFPHRGFSSERPFWGSTLFPEIVSVGRLARWALACMGLMGKGVPAQTMLLTLPGPRRSNPGPPRGVIVVGRT